MRGCGAVCGGRGSPRCRRASGCFTSLYLDRLELYNNHTSQNNTAEWGRGRGRCGSHQGCAQVLHALWGEALTVVLGSRQNKKKDEEWKERASASVVGRERQDEIIYMTSRVSTAASTRWYVHGTTGRGVCLLKLGIVKSLRCHFK